MEVAQKSSAAMLPTSTTTKISVSTCNGFLPSQSAGWVPRSRSSCVHVTGRGFKNEQGSIANKSLALLAALSLKGSLTEENSCQLRQAVGFPPTPKRSTPAAPRTQCNAIPFTTASKVKAPATNIDSARIASSSDANGTAAVVPIASIQCNNKKSSNSTTKASSATSLTTAKALTTNSNSSNSNNTAKSAVSSSSTVTTAATAGSNNAGKHYFHIPSDILDDLASRFIINVPDIELSNLIRICFQVELAHWFYLDFFCAVEGKKMQPCSIKPFAMQIFQHIPFLREHLSSIDKILDDWKNYKLSVPTYGAILISEDLNFCLLVQSYFTKSSWSFPKGKVNENEGPVHCATREVYEETGYDITELIVPNDYIEAIINYQFTRLYIVRNVSLKTQFSPRTRNEIKCCDWFPIDSLPINKNDAISKTKLGLNANSFFMIMPFVKRLKKWVNDKRAGIETRHKLAGGTYGGTAALAGGGGQSTTTATPSSTSPVAATNAGGHNQKHSNNSCRKNNKQQQKQYNDDNNALKNGGAGAAAPTVTRSRRQRHKSMGDLESVKLSNLNNSSNSTFKTINNRNNNNNNHNNINGGGGAKVNGDHSSTNGCNAHGNVVNGVGGGGNHNRSSGKSSAAGGGNVTGQANSSGQPKRQLFHSQSQNGTQNGEKNIGSFDLNRKDKQQLKSEKSAKAQKQQQQQANGGNKRVRAKSHSDKMCTQQQQQNTNRNGNNIGNNNCNSKQRVHKQQSIIITNSNNINNRNKRVAGRFTPSPLSGSGFVAVATAAALAPPTTQINIYVQNKTMVTKLPTAIAIVPATATPRAAAITRAAAIAGGATAIAREAATAGVEVAARVAAAAGVEVAAGASAFVGVETTAGAAAIDGAAASSRPMPISVSSQHDSVSSTLSLSPLSPQQPMMLQRMNPDLRIVKYENRGQHQAFLQHQMHHQHQPVKFTPSLSSWTNFSFTKNFITNIFC